jgi:hypothetical protein
MNYFSKKSLAIAVEQAGFRIVSVRTCTPFQWLGYQLIHSFTFPKKGVPSSFWNPSALGSIKDRSKNVRLLVSVLDRFGISLILMRFIDFLGAGDNWLVELEKA